MAKAKIVESASEFLSVIEKSGLLRGAELETARKICAATDDPKTAARKLLSDGVLTQWQASQLLAGFAGLVLGKYELLDVLTKSEFGRVYLAEHATLGQKVALHAMNTKGVDAQRVERFLAEVRKLSELTHPNLVRVLEVSSDNDRHFVATESCSEDLHQKVEQAGGLPLPGALELVRQAAEGLAYLHQNKIVHLELKPTNVALNEQGLVKLTDAGFHHLRNLSAAKRSDELQGNSTELAYLAPEVKAGQQPDHRADMYSLGCILHFALSGKQPLVDQEGKVSLSFPAEVPPDVAAFCIQLIAVNPAERPASMDEIVAKLQSFVSPPPIVHATKPSAAIDSVHESILDSDETDDAEQSEDEDINAEEIPDADLAGFKVKKKPRESVAAELSARTASPEQVARKQQQRMFLLIGGVAAALLLVVAGLIVGVMSLGKEKVVAQTAAPPAAEKQAPPAPVDPYGGGPPIIATDAGLSTVAPSSALSGLAGGTGNDAAGSPPGIPSPLATAAASAPLADAAANPASATTPAPATVYSAAIATTPVPPGATPKPASPMATDAKPLPPAAPTTPMTPRPEDSPEKKPPAMNPQAKPEATPGSKPDSKAAGKAEAKTATEAPQKPAAPARMFEIAAAVDLPRLPAADGSPSEAPNKVLGRVNAEANAGCFITLLGGATAMKGKTELALRSAQGGTAPRDWEFIAREATDAETIIAKLSLPKNDLAFEWTPDGLKHPTAPFLQNCALRISVGQEKPHTMALRTPQSGAAATLAPLEKSALSLRFEIEAPPDPAAIRVEPKVAELKMAVEPPAAGEKNKDDQWLYLGEGGPQSMFHVKLTTSTTARGIQLTLTPYLVLPQEKPQRLTPALRKSLPLAGAIQERKRLVDNRIAELAKVPKEKQKSAESDQLSVTKTLMEEQIKKLQQLDDVLQKLSSAQLQLRIYHDAGEAQVDLVKTGS